MQVLIFSYSPIFYAATNFVIQAQYHTTGSHEDIESVDDDLGSYIPQRHIDRPDSSSTASMSLPLEVQTKTLFFIEPESHSLNSEVHPTTSDDVIWNETGTPARQIWK